MNYNTRKKDIIDARIAFIEFIKNNENISEPVSQNIRYFCKDGTISSLFNKDEKIVTDANEVPTHDSRVWWYHGQSMYDYLYAVLDNNQLLVVFIEKDLETLESTDLWFYLYPNVDKMSVYLIPGHDNKPYFNLLDENGNRVNQFSFERIHDYEENAFGIKLTDLIYPVDRNTLVERFEGKISRRKL